MLEIRRATIEDIPYIMKFMDEHWKPGNILARDRNFFEWQFVEDGKVNMFIGIDDEEHKVYGMIGAILYNRNEHPDFSGCTWQAIKSDNPLLGIEISGRMYDELQPRYTCSAGLTQKAVRANTLLGIPTVIMDHYYRLCEREDYKIAIITNKSIPKVKDKGYTLEIIHSVEEMKQIISEEQLNSQIMSKDYYYIEKRYFKHPIYHYDIWKILNDKGEARSVMITRDEVVGERKMCKIVDYYGEIEDLRDVTFAIDELLKDKGYEYIDVYSYGVPTYIYETAGFLSCDEKCENIIPNYFHPFLKKNIVLKMTKPVVSGLRFFRGDGDQDRPC